MSDKWICTENPNHVFNHGGICDKCGALLVRYEDEKPVGVENSPLGGGGIVRFQGSHGLGIFVFDLSGSMSEQIDDDNQNNVTKIEAVASAFGSTVASLLYGNTALKKPDDYFLAIIGFSTDAQLIGFYNLLNMNKNNYEDTFRYWKEYILDKHKQHGYTTNITQALEIAKKIYDVALSNELNKQQQYIKYDSAIETFDLGSQNVSTENSVIEIPNIRVLVYSDGDHNEGTFDNAFKDAALTDAVSSSENRHVNGVMSIYFGQPETVGASQMEEIAGYCPIHKTVGMIHIMKLAHYNHLRNLIHLTSAASGFCLQCTI